MAISKLTTPVTPNDLINKTNEIIDGIEAAGTAVPSTTTPLMDGTASVGTETDYARGDHVHPTDTSRAAASHVHDASDINSGVLDVANGGTGESSLADLFVAMGLGTAAELDEEVVFRNRAIPSDATGLNDVTLNGAYYINSTSASSLSDMPVSTAGILLHFNPRGTTTLDYALQFYTTNSRSNFVLYMRKRQTTWGSWKSITFS